MDLVQMSTTTLARSEVKPSNAVICPGCEQGQMRVFYEVNEIPVHSVLLMDTRDQAVNYQRRNLRLGFCLHCGFIANTCFDPSVHEYGVSCEETQGFSPTFNAFARELAQRWFQKYDLRGQTVLEIGCGKGEFLGLLVELGAGKGIGIDPAFVPGRLVSPAADRLQFVQDLYSEKYGHIEADVICCRHTLEHIAPVSRFVRELRATIGTNQVTVLFELPDVSRVLSEAAFWDIYYEHCSYFTKGSLARLFERTGFEVVELSVEYDNQYIVLGAKTAVSGRAASPWEDDLNDTTNQVARFPARVHEIKQFWLDRINSMRADGKRLVLWGGGSKAVSFLSTLKIGDQIAAVVDINPYKQGKFIPGTGHAVVGPGELKRLRPDCVILMNRIYENEIRRQLAEMGLAPAIVSV